MVATTFCCCLYLLKLSRHHVGPVCSLCLSKRQYGFNNRTIILKALLSPDLAHPSLESCEDIVSSDCHGSSIDNHGCSSAGTATTHPGPAPYVCTLVVCFFFLFGCSC